MRIGRLFVAAFAAYAALAAAPALAQDGRWRRAETENFIVYYDGSERKLIEVARTLENFHFTLAAITNASDTAPAQSKLEIYLLRGPQMLEQVRPGSRDQIAGFYRSSEESIAAFLIYEESWGPFAQEVLKHEYAHHFLLHRFPAAYPRWYIEGWAEFVSTIDFSNGRAIVGTPGTRSDALIANTMGLQRSGFTQRPSDNALLPIEHLLAPERVPEEQQNDEFVGRFYVHSWLATSFLANRPERNASLLRYVRALGDGGDPITSFEPTFGVSPAVFDAEIRAYLLQGTTGRVAIRLPEQEPTVTVTRLPSTMDDLLLSRARLRLGISLDHQPDRLTAEIMREARRYPDDAFVQGTAARMEMINKDFAAARTRLGAVLSAHPDDVEALYLLGLTHYLEASDADDAARATASLAEARRIAARGFRADPDHYATLFLYAMTFAELPQPLNEAQLNVLGRALELAPQAGSIRLRFAHELMEAQHYDEAAEVLRPLLYAPHSETRQQRARVLFEAARQRLPPPPDTAEEEVEEED